MGLSCATDSCEDHGICTGQVYPFLQGYDITDIIDSRQSYRVEVQTTLILCR